MVNMDERLQADLAETRRAIAEAETSTKIARAKEAYIRFR